MAFGGEDRDFALLLTVLNEDRMTFEEELYRIVLRRNSKLHLLRWHLVAKIEILLSYLHQLNK